MIVTPADRELRSHAYSRLRSHFSRLVEKFEPLQPQPTHFEKSIQYLNKLEPMRENDDRTFSKSPILVGKVTGGLCLGAWERESLLPKSSDVFGY